MKKTKKMNVVLAMVLSMTLLFGATISANAASAEVKFDVKQTDINVAINVPTTVPIIFNEDGTNTYVNFLTKAYFDGKVSTKFNIKNIENNHDDIVFEIFDEEGESLYKSKKIAPGYEMNCIELDRELSKGRHECTIEIHYAVEGQVSTVFPIILIAE